MDNVVLEEKKKKVKRKEDQQLKRIIDLMIIVDKAIQKIAEKCIIT
jgi:hypothetical protein